MLFSYGDQNPSFQYQLNAHQQFLRSHQHQENGLEYYEENEPPLLMAIRIMDGLFVGNAVAAQDDDFLFSNKVTHIVNCAGLEAPNIFVDNGIEYLTFPWRDISTTQILDGQDRNISRIAIFIDKAFERGECVLVHSFHGISRSCVILAAYLIYKYGWSLDQSLSFMHVAHPDMKIQTYFVRQLKLLSKRKSRPAEVSDDPTINYQQTLLKHTYLNSVPYNETEYTNTPIVITQKKRRVNFEQNEHILGPRSNISPKPNAKIKSILKRKENSEVSTFEEMLSENYAIQEQLSIQPVDSVEEKKKVNITETSSIVKSDIANNIEVLILKHSDKVEGRSSPNDSLENFSQLQIITGVDANKTEKAYVAKQGNSDELYLPNSQVEYKEALNPSPTYNVRKRPTNFSSIHEFRQRQESQTCVQSNGKSATLLSVSRNHTAPQPKKYRGPTPPKRHQKTLEKKDSSNTIHLRSSLSNPSPTPYNYPPSAQIQEPLFVKVNRKASTPNSSSLQEQGKRISTFRSNTGSSSLLRGTVSSSLKTGSGLEVVQLRKRPSSAPKARTAESQLNFTPIAKSNSVSSMQSLYKADIQEQDRSASSASLNSACSPKRKKKKKKPKTTKKEAESRLMRPTLSFLRKTVDRSK